LPLLHQKFQICLSFDDGRNPLTHERMTINPSTVMIRIELGPMLINPRLPEQLKFTAIAGFFIGDSGRNCQANFCAGTRFDFRSRYPIGLQFPLPAARVCGGRGGGLWELNVCDERLWRQA
jgi:hypothetical protein